MITIKACLSPSSTFRKFTIPESKSECDALKSISEGGVGLEYEFFGYDALMNKLVQLYQLSHDDREKLTVRYVDDEGE
jgi:hypothetical protein